MGLRGLGPRSQGRVYEAAYMGLRGRGRVYETACMGLCGQSHVVGDSMIRDCEVCI